ncbi:hypothetical protein FPQ18DRAFT_384954 [Pyronema domesticum]|nr:hypothetical protein FPQ18DRAFT_384954 [Pyronema domesticum]
MWRSFPWKWHKEIDVKTQHLFAAALDNGNADFLACVNSVAAAHPATVSAIIAAATPDARSAVVAALSPAVDASSPADAASSTVASLPAASSLDIAADAAPAASSTPDDADEIDEDE